MFRLNVHAPSHPVRRTIKLKLSSSKSPALSGIEFLPFLLRKVSSKMWEKRFVMKMRVWGRERFFLWKKRVKIIFEIKLFSCAKYSVENVVYRGMVIINGKNFRLLKYFGFGNLWRFRRVKFHHFNLGALLLKSRFVGARVASIKKSFIKQEEIWNYCIMNQSRNFTYKRSNET